MLPGPTNVVAATASGRVSQPFALVASHLPLAFGRTRLCLHLVRLRAQVAELEAGEVAFEVLETHPERESTLELLGHSAESSIPQEEHPVILSI